jgi:hypothetical protein
MEMQMFLKSNENENTASKTYGYSKVSTKRKVYSYECQLKKKNQVSNTLMTYLELPEKQAKPNISR